MFTFKKQYIYICISLCGAYTSLAHKKCITDCGQLTGTLSAITVPAEKKESCLQCILSDPKTQLIEVDLQNIEKKHPLSLFKDFNELMEEEGKFSNLPKALINVLGVYRIQRTGAIDQRTSPYYMWKKQLLQSLDAQKGAF